MGGGCDTWVGHGGHRDAMEAAWVGRVHGWSKGARGYALVMREARGGGLRAGVWGVGHQRVGCGEPSEHGDASVHVWGWGVHQGGMGTRAWGAGWP